MPTKNKIRLENLKVSSFVTELNSERDQVKGGATLPLCNTVTRCTDCYSCFGCTALTCTACEECG
jgi:hypothetical protein